VKLVIVSTVSITGWLKNAISIARTYMGRRKHFTGQSFWARGYYVSTVGRDEETVRNYIKHQESEDVIVSTVSITGWFF
jgi:putative transposase